MMSSLGRTFLLSASAAAMFAWASPAAADPAGDKVLGAMDVALNRAKTQFIEFEVVDQEPGKSERKLGLTVKLKGEKKVSEFLAPADMKGTKVLVLSPTQMYVYLPAFGKIRRIASHVTDQGFMGLAFSQDDFATTTYSASYSATVASETGSEWVIVATPKPGETTPYGKLEFTVTKDKSLPVAIKYYDAGGKHVKTETRTGYTCQGDVCTSQELKMVDHAKGGHWTKMIRKQWKVNESIPDSEFSKRSLAP